MKKSYQVILISYIIMQLLLGIGTNLTYQVLQSFGLENIVNLQLTSISIWYTVSFLTVLIISLYTLKDEFRQPYRYALSLSTSFVWAIAGVFIALFVQNMAILIESLFGVQAGSENTQNILSLIEKAPIIIFITSIIGPILEEIVFRKIIFGTLYKKYGFFISAFVSSILFALAHFEFVHILLYFSIGFTFAYLYNKTNRIIVPILSHTIMNTSVIVLALL